VHDVVDLVIFHEVCVLLGVRDVESRVLGSEVDLRLPNVRSDDTALGTHFLDDGAD
jgi:hypothetical protein